MPRSVYMGLKGHTLFGYAPQFCQTIHLIPAAISKYGPFPVHKGMKPSQLLHNPMSRSQIEMIGIGQYNLNPGIFQILRGQCLYRTLGTYRDKGRCLKSAMGCLQPAESGT